jgi:prepilin-type N-terminal cleavage/methylation domain-containing protein
MSCFACFLQVLGLSLRRSTGEIFVNRRRIQSGFSLIEALVVIAIILIMVGTAIIEIGPALKGAKSSTALETTLGLLRRYHEAAVNQRKIYRITFTAPRTIQVDQQGYDPSGDVTYTPISTDTLPVETQFLCVKGIPTTQTNLPDGFGDGQTAIDFSVDYGGGQTVVLFQKDGRATDINGRPNNGVVYIAQPGDLTSSKAVTVWGATGRVKGWRLTVQSDGSSIWRSL